MGIKGLETDGWEVSGYHGYLIKIDGLMATGECNCDPIINCWKGCFIIEFIYI
jgi:hypothetical protein